MNPHQSHSSDHFHRPLGHAPAMASRPASFDRRTRAEVDSWVEIGSQPSSSSLSSIGDDIVTTGLRVQAGHRTKRRRAQRQGASTHLNIVRTYSGGAASSQEEYEESESESDQVMTSSNEGPVIAASSQRSDTAAGVAAPQSSASEDAPSQVSDDDDDENRTAINYPIKNENCFTPLPNAFSHPPSSTSRRNSAQQASGSYFPATRPAPMHRPSTRHSYPATTQTRRPSHMPQNPLSPSFNAAVEHDEALKASLHSLLSVAAAARGLPKGETKRPASTALPPRSSRVDPMTFRLVPESALQNTPSPPLQEPMFKPTIRRSSTQSTATTSDQKEGKRKAVPGRNSSREQRSSKKARRADSREDVHVTPTLLTWVVSAGVVVFLSALSFSAGYSVGKEAGRIEGSTFTADEQLRSCAREAGRSSLGLKRSLARSAIQV